MMKFTLALGLIALVVSCGKQEELPAGPQGVGQRIELSDSPEFTARDKKNLGQICSALKVKESIYRTQYAGKGVIFDFSTKKKGCTDSVATEFLTGAKVEFNNGKMTYVKMGIAAVIFEDIPLRSEGVFKDFCDKLDSNALNERYIASGIEAKWIYLEQKNDNIIVAVETGYDYDKDGVYSVEMKEQFMINNTASKYQGIAIERNVMTRAGCRADEVYQLTSKLLKIQ
jgi:hypothetical protein